jgi:phosphatidylserine decarboxylase
MSSRIVNSYYDRYRREFREERVYASDFLYWMYNTTWGCLATDLFIKHRAFSRLYGWLHRLPWSRKKIEPFVRQLGIDPKELPYGPRGYDTFHDFFIREVDLANRPIILDSQVCICPVDGKVLAYPSINRDEHYRIKRSAFNLAGFLRDEALADLFSGGSMAVCRLSLGDNHRFHFPDPGRPGEAVAIPGFYHAGGPYSRRSLIPFFAENYRMRTVFASDHFALMHIVEIGALTVGSIMQTYRPGEWISKGEQKGYFALGSTVVLLFQKGAIEFDTDLLANTEQEIETYVHLGDSLGKVPVSRKL